METLNSYTLNDVTPEGDYTILFIFDDDSISEQVIHFGPLEDEEDSSAADKLDVLVQDYAKAYILGKKIEQTREVMEVPMSLQKSLARQITIVAQALITDRL